MVLTGFRYFLNGHIVLTQNFQSWTLFIKLMQRGRFQESSESIKTNLQQI